MFQLLLAAIWQLIEGRRIRLLIFLLFVLETSQYPSGLCPEQVTLFVRLHGEQASSSHIISRLNLPHVDEIKCQPKICTPKVLLQQTDCSILVLLELMLPFVYGISFWISFLLLSRILAIQRSSMSLVSQLTPFAMLNCALL